MAINAVRRTDNDDNAKIREEFFVDIYASAMEEMRPKEIKVSPAPPIVFNDTLSYGTEAIGDMEPVGACVFEPVAARINKEKRNVSFVFGEDGVDVLNDAALSAMPGRTCYIEPKMPETAQPKPKFMTKEYFASKLSEFWGWATGKTENDRLFAPNPLIRTYAPAVEPAIRMAETIPSGKPFYAKAAWKGILSVLERMRGSVMAKDGFTSPKFSFQVVKINDYVE